MAQSMDDSRQRLLQEQINKLGIKSKMKKKKKENQARAPDWWMASCSPPPAENKLKRRRKKKLYDAVDPTDLMPFTPSIASGPSESFSSVAANDAEQFRLMSSKKKVKKRKADEGFGSPVRSPSPAKKVRLEEPPKEATPGARKKKKKGKERLESSDRSALDVNTNETRESQGKTLKEKKKDEVLEKSNDSSALPDDNETTDHPEGLATPLKNKKKKKKHKESEGLPEPPQEGLSMVASLDEEGLGGVEPSSSREVGSDGEETPRKKKKKRKKKVEPGEEDGRDTVRDDGDDPSPEEKEADQDSPDKKRKKKEKTPSVVNLVLGVDSDVTGAKATPRKKKKSPKKESKKVHDSEGEKEDGLASYLVGEDEEVWKDQEKEAPREKLKKKKRKEKVVSDSDLGAAGAGADQETPSKKRKKKKRKSSVGEEEDHAVGTAPEKDPCRDKDGAVSGSSSSFSGVEVKTKRGKKQPTIMQGLSTQDGFSLRTGPAEAPETAAAEEEAAGDRMEVESVDLFAEDDRRAARMEALAKRMSSNSRGAVVEADDEPAAGVTAWPSPSKSPSKKNQRSPARVIGEREPTPGIPTSPAAEGIRFRALNESVAAPGTPPPPSPSRSTPITKKTSPKKAVPGGDPPANSPPPTPARSTPGSNKPSPRKIKSGDSLASHPQPSPSFVSKTSSKRLSPRKATRGSSSPDKNGTPRGEREVAVADEIDGEKADEDDSVRSRQPGCSWWEGQDGRDLIKMEVSVEVEAVDVDRILEQGHAGDADTGRKEEERPGRSRRSKGKKAAAASGHDQSVMVVEASQASPDDQEEVADSDDEDGALSTKALLAFSNEQLLAANPRMRSDKDLRAEDKRVAAAKASVAAAGKGGKHRGDDQVLSRLAGRILGRPEMSELNPQLGAVIEHILKCDFPLPAIQTVPHSLFGHPTQEARERMRGLNPEFTTGRFDHYEDAVIVQRIKALFTELGIGPKPGLRIFKALSRIKNSAGQRHMSRLILAGYVGRPLLGYRLLNDVYLRIMRLMRLGSGEKGVEPGTPLYRKVIAYLEKHGPAYSQCRRDLDLELVLTSKDLRGIYMSHQASRARVQKGAFSGAEDATLIRLAMTSAGTVDVRRMAFDDVDWGAAAEELCRPRVSVQRRWSATLWPILAKYQAGVDCESGGVGVKSKVVELLLKAGVRRRTQIDFVKMRKDHFPYETATSLRIHLSTVLNRVGKGDGNKNAPPDFRAQLAAASRLLKGESEGAPDGEVAESSAHANLARRIVRDYEDVVADIHAVGGIKKKKKAPVVVVKEEKLD